MVSALWHGFYPGYFISFFMWSLFSLIAKSCYKISLKYPNFNYENPIYKILRFCASLTFMNYFGVPF